MFGELKTSSGFVPSSDGVSSPASETVTTVDWGLPALFSARARANTPRSDEEIIAVIDSVFEVVQGNGQLDNTDLTLRDLQTIKRSFFNTLKQSYHPRIKYPEMPKKAQSSTATEVKSAS